MKNKLSINLEVSLVEIILSILIFAVAGVIMLTCFAYANFTQVKANDITIAGNMVQTDSEMIRASLSTEGAYEFLSKNYSLIHESSKSRQYIRYFDKEWNPCSEDEDEYQMVTEVIEENEDMEGSMLAITITVQKSRPYPFIGKPDETVFSVVTKKFYPIFGNGRQ